jgi:hypothetical protein
MIVSIMDMVVIAKKNELWQPFFKGIKIGESME